MPYSLVVVDWDKIKGPNVKSRYPPAEPHYNDDIPMQVFMMHASKEPPEEQITLNLSGMDVLSQFVQFQEEGTMRRIIILLLLKPEEKPMLFKRKMIKFKDEIIGKVDSEDLDQMVKKYYKDNFEEGVEDFSVEGMKEKLISQAQTLLEKGQTQLAREIIEKSERVPRTIFNLMKQAEQAYDTAEYIEASKHYEDIVALFSEIREDEMAANYAQKSIEVKEIPKLLDEQGNILDKIKKQTKKVDFNKLIDLLTQAFRVSNKLRQSDKARGYSDQALALKQYLQADPDKKEAEEESEDEVVLEIVDDE